jgi:NAD(P)H-dependent FMN reductase
MKTPKILVLAGSVRHGSTNRMLAVEAEAALQKAGVEATFADLREYALPIYDADLEADIGLPEAARALKKLAKEADGFAIASPEYNGSYPALLKNAIDWISRPEPGEGPLAAFVGKPAAILSASPGVGGGQRVLRELRHFLEGIRIKVLPHEVSIGKAGEAFDADGRLTRPADIENLKALTAELAGAVGQKELA